MQTKQTNNDAARVAGQLNENEKLVLFAIINAAHDASGGDFAIGEEVAGFVEGFSKKQVAGYISSLQSKGFISVSGPAGQVQSQITIHNNEDGSEYDPEAPRPKAPRPAQQTAPAKISVSIESEIAPGDGCTAPLSVVLHNHFHAGNMLVVHTKNNQTGDLSNGSYFDAKEIGDAIKEYERRCASRHVQPYPSK